MKKAVLILVALLFPFGITAQSKLERSKSEVKSKSSSSNSTSSESSFDNEEAEFGLFAELGFLVFGFATIGSYSAEEHLHNSVSEYPFQYNGVGNYIQLREGENAKYHRIDIENTILFESNSLFGNHLHVKYRPFQYFFIKTEYLELLELNKFENTTNNLSLFYFTLAYDRIRTERFNLGWRIGASYMANEVQKTGLVFGVDAEYFAMKKFSFSTSLKWSSINDTPVNAYEIKAKYHKQNYFFSFGFEHLKIGTPPYNFVTLGAGIYL